MIISRKVTMFILAILAIVLFKHLVMNKMVVMGNSMADTYLNGDVIWVEKVSYHHEINRFDIVVVSAKKDGLSGYIIKRVIGLPNETILIKNGRVYINGVFLNHDYGELIQNSGAASSPFKLGNDEYFVMGDNRNGSSDSRDPWLGAVKINRIMGKPFYRIFPLNRIGKEG